MSKTKIYITYCSAKKDDTLKNSDLEVYPEELYTSKRIQRFIEKCNEKKVKWAIFSDLYGIWFPKEKHKWYEKHPNKVTSEEFNKLLADFDLKLKRYNEVWFYYNPCRFHNLYDRLIKNSSLVIIKFSNEYQIKKD